MSVQYLKLGHDSFHIFSTLLLTNHPIIC